MSSLRPPPRHLVFGTSDRCRLPVRHNDHSVEPTPSINNQCGRGGGGGGGRLELVWDQPKEDVLSYHRITPSSSYKVKLRQRGTRATKKQHTPHKLCRTRADDSKFYNICVRNKKQDGLGFLTVAFGEGSCVSYYCNFGTQPSLTFSIALVFLA